MAIDWLIAPDKKRDVPVTTIRRWWRSLFGGGDGGGRTILSAGRCVKSEISSESGTGGGVSTSNVENIASVAVVNRWFVSHLQRLDTPPPAPHRHVRKLTSPIAKPLSTAQGGEQKAVLIRKTRPKGHFVVRMRTLIDKESAMAAAVAAGHDVKVRGMGCKDLPAENPTADPYGYDIRYAGD